jgi:P4 family phage/plasmid primase-like protien
MPTIEPTFQTVLNRLHQGGAWAYWWTLPDKVSTWWPVGNPLPLPNGQRNTYFGVHPIDIQKEPGQRSTIADISAINCLFAEYDAKDFGGDKSKAWARLEAVDLPASIIIDSGGGYHGYWLLKEPFIIRSEDDRRYAQQVQRQWVAYAGGDDGAQDLARVLRVPGTKNYKPEYGPDFPTVKIVRADFHYYDLDTLEELAIFGLATQSTLPESHDTSSPDTTTKIKDGERNDTLTSLAGSMRLRGMTPEAIEAGLLAENQERCNPPLPEDEVKAIARSVAKYPPKESKRRTPTDDELAQRWLDDHPLTAYGLGDWRRYTVGVWPALPEDEVNREVREVLIAAKGEGVRPSRYALSSVAEMARLTVSIPSEQWDADHDVLVCRNGALKISSRELLPHDPAYYVTESLPFDFDPNADAPTWRYVLETTIPESANLLQEYAGLCLTTDTSLETALWLYGLPGGGRSTVIGGIEAMLGNRAGVLGLAAIERSQFALTNLPGKTLVTSTEQPNLYIRSSHILNAIISGEPLIVERKYEHPYQIIPRAKILWAMNDLPRISEVNSGLFRRVKIIQFPPRDEDRRDPSIKERVKQEAAGILNWALVGLDRLRERGHFEIPPCVQEATAEFKATNDIPLMFVNEMCLTGPDYRTQGSTLYTAYKNWCMDTGHKPQSSTSLADDWKRLGFERYRAAGKTFWRGVGLVDPAMP